MEKITQKKRSIRESLERVDKYLQDKNEFVSISTISQELNLNFYSIKKYLQTLEKFGRVEVVSNGNVTLVKFRGENATIPNA